MSGEGSPGVTSKSISQWLCRVNLYMISDIPRRQKAAMAVSDQSTPSEPSPCRRGWPRRGRERSAPPGDGTSPPNPLPYKGRGRSFILLTLLTLLILASPIPALAIDNPQADQNLSTTLTLHFQQERQAVLDDAKAHLTAIPWWRRRHSAVVFDLDETLMDTRAYYAIYKVYDPASWDAWMDRRDCPAIPEVLSFLEWVQRKGFQVYFLTGRREHQRAQTLENLTAMGVNMARVTQLILKPDDYTNTSAIAYKVGARQRIEASGFTVVATLGDQQSDITGEATGRGFKLPNPIYTIP
ncbi:MAG: HAD family acid phosphatase [Candidatus Melainabacteria bacterium]